MFLLAYLPFLSITINWDPTLADLGPFTLTWHGLFTALGIIGGVTLSVWLAKKDGIPPEIGQEIALVGVPSAIVGARLFYVIEHWGSKFSDDPLKAVTGITEGGITLYGGLIGGVLGGLIYALLHKWPIAITFDAAAPGMLLGQAIGRLGDLVNGEHIAKQTDLPWGVEYTNPGSPQYSYFHNVFPEKCQQLAADPLGNCAVHPTAGGYEMLGDLLILGLLLLVFRRFLRVPGWLFCSYVAMYGILRFFLSYTRVDEKTYFDIPTPQIVSGLLIGLAVIMAGIFYRKPGPITPEYADRVWGDLPLPDEAPPPASV
ncbi:MAG: prolipoprotein diacylglyceryl transferase [Tepidiformaceae bacterium]